MPNHVTTVCTVTGLPIDVAGFKSRHIVTRKNERTGEDFLAFDFDSIVPMPAVVKATIRDAEKIPIGDFNIEMRARCMLASGRTLGHDFRGFTWMPSRVRSWSDLAEWLDEKHPAAKEWARKSLLCAAETGAPGWYEWSTEHWGTKWNAYDYAERFTEPGKFVFKFETAWAFPLPIFEKLAEIHPLLRYDVVSIDEGGPEYEGHFAWKDRAFGEKPASDERYRFVYGEDRDADEGEEAEASS